MAGHNTWHPGLQAVLGALCLLLVATASHGASLERLVMPGPVSQAHADLEDDCSNCHAPVSDQTQNELCVVCHDRVGQDIDSNTGFHGRHPLVASDECQVCHAEHEGRDAETLAFDWSDFEHTLTDFPLTGPHSGLECATCHDDGAPFTAAPATCVGCHARDDPHERRFSQDCASCHVPDDWHDVIFDHDMTGFPLSGDHADLACTSCHVSDTSVPVPDQCNGCHAKDDVHAGTLGSDCQSCHSTSSWATGFFEHATTGFSLTRGHAGLTCDICHASAAPLAGETCNACHADDDVHDGKNGNDCESCHTSASWAASTFNHLGASGFALIDTHAALSCDACHLGEVTDSIGSECVDCHLSHDVHEGQLGAQCGDCHGETRWPVGVRFDHHHTTFPLLGLHGVLECSACHVSGRFKDVDPRCSTCHVDEDPHAGTMADECGSCHNPSGWNATAFDHAASSAFPLIGAHDRIACTSCHAKPVLMQAKTPEDCAQCHRNDPHQDRFGDDCGRCHGTDDFHEIERLR